MEYKVCSKCGENKEFSEYCKMPKGKFGLAAACKACGKLEDTVRRHQKKAGTFVSKYDPALQGEKFLVDAILTYGELYDYSLVEFTAMGNPVSIRCVKHDLVFKQKPPNHLAGLGGCRECALERQRGLTMKTNEQFIEECLEIKAHKGKYSYERTKYVGASEKVEIFCKRHNDYFWRSASSHLCGGGCPKCGAEDGNDRRRLTHEGFLKRAKAAHGDTYTFSNVVYSYNYVPVQVTCKVHGDFPISPSNLFLGKGCPKCSVYGYNIEKPGSIYVLYCDNITKIGITNRDIGVRLAEINKSSGKDFKVYYSQSFDDGAVAISIEWSLKLLFDTEYSKPVSKFSGSTECYLTEDREKFTKLIKQSAINILGMQ